ncbi:hypothetical protein BGW38_009921, partial [Lunasporangiospora selenospora]
ISEFYQLLTMVCVRLLRIVPTRGKGRFDTDGLDDYYECGFRRQEHLKDYYGKIRCPGAEMYQDGDKALRMSRCDVATAFFLERMGGVAR